MSNDTIISIIAGLMAGVAFYIGATCYIGATWGEYVGRIQTASGQYECKLIEQPDHTTEWKCEEAK